MADPFSIASGIAGFLSLAMEITKILVDYTANVKSAPSDVTKMLEEVDALVEVLEQLKDFLEDNSDTISETIKNGFQENSALSTALKICKTEIEKLRRVLHKFKVRRTDKAWLDKLQRLKWPFSKEECLEITQRLNRCSQTFTFSMTISNWCVVPNSGFGPEGHALISIDRIASCSLRHQQSYVDTKKLWKTSSALLQNYRLAFLIFQLF